MSARLTALMKRDVVCVCVELAPGGAAGVAACRDYFQSLDDMEGASRHYFFVPRDRFSSLYPESSVAQTGRAGDEDFSIPEALREHVRGIYTEAPPVHA